MSDHNSKAPDAAPPEETFNAKRMILILSLGAAALMAVILALAYTMSLRSVPAVSAMDLEKAMEARIQKVGMVQIRGEDSNVLKTGEEVYKLQCSTCHATGALGSPKFGDKAAWAPRIPAGYAALLQAALKGKNAMTPQGGGMFKEVEVGRALVYMVNAAGGNFEEPKVPEAPQAGASEAK